MSRSLQKIEAVMNWKEFQETAPEMATLGMERFQRSGVSLLATLRKDGSPRISPVEPLFIGDHLLLGMMWHSMKALDLLRDARCVIHSAVTNTEGDEGEFKLRGRAVELTEERYYQAIREKWEAQPSTCLHVFSVNIESASFIAYDIGKGEMIMKQWDTQRGLRETRRTYPY
jgi:hypothetical protein